MATRSDMLATAGTLATTTDLAAIGALAMANAQKADAMGKRARSDMTFVISQSLAAEVHCFYQTADKTVICNEHVKLAYLIEPGYVADVLTLGNAKAQTSVWDACIKALTGVDQPTTAQRDCFKAARDAAWGLFAALGDGMPAKVRRTAKGNLQVPYSVMHEAPKVDAAESEHDTWQARKDSMFTVDGTRGNSFAELRSKVSIKPAKGDDRASAGQGKVEPATWFEAVKAKLAKAEYAGERGLDWVAYVADWTGADLIQAAMLFSAVSKDKNEIAF